jgi:RHS repeat-associated protein
MSENGETLYFGIDHLGSVNAVVRQDGTIISEIRYEPYGEVRHASGGSSSDKGFTGQSIESGMGLMDYNARYYSPFLGRFVSPDTTIPDLKDVKSYENSQISVRKMDK